jgi:16S rRNA processing protein RimM
MSENTEKLHILAKITGYYGVKGWVKLYSYTEPRENIVHYPSLKIKRSQKGAQWQDIRLDSGKAHGKGVVAHFVGYDDRDIAASLIGAELAAYRSDFQTTAKDEYYWSDLIGLTVVNQDNIELGQVTRLMETAANDVLVIKPVQQAGGAKAETDILIPFVLDHYIIEVDLDAGTLTVDWQTQWNESD